LHHIELQRLFTLICQGEKISIALSLSHSLKDKRKKLNLTRKQLAEKAGVGLRYYIKEMT